MKIDWKKIYPALKQYYGCPFEKPNCDFLDVSWRGERACFNEEKQKDCIKKFIKYEEPNEN